MKSIEKRYQIFISSTFNDLEDERESVMKAILNVNCFPAGMELFPACDSEQFEYIQTIIDKSDYYVLIIAGRYGSEDDNGISYTEKEYDYALSKNIPILTFVYKDIINLPLSKTDNNSAKFKKLQDFIQKATHGRMASFWNNKYELQEQVEKSLRNSFITHPRTGWIKGDSLLSNNEPLLPKKKVTPENNKDKLLLAIYNEYSKDISDMEKNINPKILNIDSTAFPSLLEKLQNESLIIDVSFARGNGRILATFTHDIKITPTGINYLKNKSYI
ncbi:YjcQ protein [Clostridium sp. DSM 8431]|uniref:YjcQ family protein n=1 Tax=Clostridium sp. DSM 8431 TaxID=1761781 RepID=UPI0008F181EF|nr:YjcQ family protein [Clostridium sp. DSM 8431]SFU86715.1 YjcQ protein [Clostridium sp. DSM 8431]